MTPPTQPTNVEALADKVRTLAPARKLEMAAALADRGLLETAEVIADIAISELRALRLFGNEKSR